MSRRRVGRSHDFGMRTHGSIVGAIVSVLSKNYTWQFHRDRDIEPQGLHQICQFCLEYGKTYGVISQVTHRSICLDGTKLLFFYTYLPFSTVWQEIQELRFHSQKQWRVGRYGI